MKTWIFQGNPKFFNVDAYLREFRVVLWMVRQKHLAPRMNVGDSVYLWRADAGDEGSGGVVAHGSIIDTPKELDDAEAAKYYYTAQNDLKPTLRARILLDSVHIRPPKFSREQLKADAILSELPILQNAHATNFEVASNQAIRLNEIYFDGEQEPASSDDSEAPDFPEGRQAFVTHRKRERNPALIRAAKANALKAFGRLSCHACGFDFGEVYGRFGEGFIEAHHTIPVSELNDDSTSSVNDIALVCSNCHRVLHRRRPWLRIEQLKELLPGKNGT